MNTVISPEHHLLRANIETQLDPPSVILVTSARARDGKSLTAYGLAETLAQAGHRIALVDVIDGRSPASIDGMRSNSRGFAKMSFSGDGPRSSRSEVVNFVQNLRDAFDYAIVDGAPLLKSNAVVMLANAVDGILLTLRTGRRQSDDDVLMTKMLAQSKVPLLGVVAVASERIARFRLDSETTVRSNGHLAIPHDADGDDVLATASLAR